MDFLCGACVCPGRRLRFHDVYEESEEVLGTGACAIVKKCTHNESAREYAVKIISKEGMQRAEIEILSEEKQIIKKLDHRNVVKFYGSFSDAKDYRLVFELLNGGDLYQYIIDRKRTSHCENNVIRYMRDIFTGVQYCHTKNIIHRDLKPPNLSLTIEDKWEVVKLVDFGLAVDTKGKARGKHGDLGTRKYKAPEMVQGQKYGTPVDLWACGCVLYNLLSGTHPSTASFPSPYWDRVSESAKDLIKQLLNENQNGRITAAEALNHSFFNPLEEESQYLGDAIVHLTEFTQREMWKTAGGVGMVTSSLLVPIIANAMPSPQQCSDQTGAYLDDIVKE